MKKGSEGIYCRYIKRIFDVVFALLALTVFCWLYLILAVLIRIKLGSPIIFKQERPGKNEKAFTLYKFRTMTDQKDADGNLLSDDIRLTKFGKRLRATSLDELPEAWNILKGDMSIVGPRPLLTTYLPYYTEEERHRHDVRPGLTGLAQVSGRNYLEWKQRFQLDTYYVSNVSLWLDIKIAVKTVIKTIRRSDIAVGNEQVLLNLDEERGADHGNN